MIRAHDLHKSLKTKTGTVHAVSGVSFEARDGQITGLLGPNGAGKTTTLRMLYTLMKPDQGRIEVDGVDPTIDPVAVRRALGVLLEARQRLFGTADHGQVGQALHPCAVLHVLHARAQSELRMRIGARVELFRVEEQCLRRQHRPFRITLHQPVAIARVLPEALERGLELRTVDFRPLRTGVAHLPIPDSCETPEEALTWFESLLRGPRAQTKIPRTK